MSGSLAGFVMYFVNAGLAEMGDLGLLRELKRNRKQPPPIRRRQHSRLSQPAVRDCRPPAFGTGHIAVVGARSA